MKKNSINAYLMRHLIPALILVLTFTSFISAYADTPDKDGKSADTILSRHSLLKIGYEKTRLPEGQSMGIIGATYLVEIGRGFHFGPAVYGEISGDRGGFFSIGGELAWHHTLISKLELQTGLFAGGGGGGGGTQVWGGGLMLRPHADLLWDFGYFKAGISASHVDFPNGGDISSGQIGFVLVRDSSFAYLTSDWAGHKIDLKNRQGIGGDRLLITMGSYFPGSNVRKTGGEPSKDYMGYVGTRLEQFIMPSLYWGVEASGAASGDADGYAELLGELGAEASVWKDRITFGSRLALGMGGGGGVSVGGGFLGKLGAYATFNPNRSIHITLEGGYAYAPNGDFKAPYGSVNLGFDLDHPFDAGTPATVAACEFIFGSEHYFDAAYKNGSKRDIDVVTVKLNRYINDFVYLTGQAHSAWNGESGSYSAGLIGAGLRSPKLASILSVSAEMLAGAAGGASLDTEGGMIVKPMAYLNLDLTKEIGIKIGAGRIMSIKGELDSTVLDAALCFNFGIGGR